MMSQRTRWISILLAGLLCAFAAVLGPAASAELDDDDPVTILATASRSIGGTAYVEIDAMMNGVAPGGTYSVPITLLFPENAADANGSAVVDVVNTTGFLVVFADTFDPADPESTPFFPPTNVARELLGDAFLAAKGYTYAAVHWDRESIELAALIGHPLGPDAHVSADADAPYILADLDELLKNPPSSLAALPGLEKTIAFGESQSGSFLSQLFFLSDIATGYDGALIVSGTCGDSCGPAPSDMKVIRVNTETDVQLYGSFVDRDVGTLAADNYRVYEVAGVSHLPMDLVDIEDTIATLFPDYFDTLLVPVRQNPAPLAPVTRAMLEHMHAWLADDDDEPPSSVYLDGPVGNGKIEKLAPPRPNGRPTNWRVYRLNRDGDGNAAGGIRLPPVRTVVNGSAVGAPLGQHDGLERETPLDFRGFAVLLGGSFIPLSQDEIDDRYPDHTTYFHRVRGAADHARAQGWILAADRAAYVQRAAQCPVGRRDLTYDDIVACIELR